MRKNALHLMFYQIHIFTTMHLFHADNCRGHGINNKSAVFRPSWPYHVWYVYPTMNTNATIELNK